MPCKRCGKSKKRFKQRINGELVMKKRVVHGKESGGQASDADIKHYKKQVEEEIKQVEEEKKEAEELKSSLSTAREE